MTDPKRQPDRLVERVIEAVGQLPVPPGPPEAVVRAAVDAGATAFVPRRPSILERIAHMDRKTRFSAAAAVLIVAGVLVWALMPGASVAWAQIVQRMEDVKTVTFKLTLTGPDGRSFTYDMAVRQPDRMRVEMQAPVHTINIMNLSTGQMLTLLPDQKIALRVNLGDRVKDPKQNPAMQDWFGRIKRLLNQPRQPLGLKQIGDVQADGFRIVQGSETVTLWVDPRTDLPVEMEFNVLMGSSKATASDWQFDKPLDPKLFALDVPEGYTLQHQVDLSHAGIEDVAGMLRIWAESRGGTFPDSLAPTAFQQEFVAPATAPTPQEEQRLAQTLGSAFLFLSQQGRATYAGKGVKLGDAATPIYWYQPADSKMAKVIYGDLSIREVDPAALPATRPATSSAP